ncbi:prokaryotic E2 ligase family D protein [Mucilaginibacter flavidus]|uniref:prokaryotic E2 ligase family D protein n=1 Tax=Mucilaginibacter flavidus TaxID=2949309 RepID=UPI0020926CA7|nr:prokaryotic E2 ligase family D protein [Mucilaginibacter flavidus]MCO5946752.1 prokaryotic E2 ligase family D protein [Mucilaginibacter flavidus]
MKDLTNTFGNLYQPVKALLIMQKTGNDHQSDFYIESYDMDVSGCPINGHPLSIQESHKLAKALQVNEKKAQGFLNPKGLMPPNVLTINSSSSGFAVWHTPPQQIKLLFIESLGIPSGMAHVPAMVWKAGKNSLQVFAVTETDFTEDTLLYHAPYFNVYPDGRVCMGNVQISIPKDCGLEQFMELWQSDFFNSYFSHLFGGHQPVKGNIVQLWQHLTESGEQFPTDVLIPNKFQIKHLIR